jgi:phage/plasmid-associated DNA primase
MTDKKDLDDGLTFSDSDDEDVGTDPVRNEVEFRLQENIESTFRAFMDFMSNPAYINPKGDPTTNIVDRHSNKCYKMPDRKISLFFKFLEACRRRKLKTMMYEKQDEYSGCMLDFDIKQEHGKTQIENTHYHRLCIGVFKILMECLDFPKSDNPKREYYVAFTKKPRVMFNEDGSYYKDGLHMIIPGVQITREVKRYVIAQMVETQLMEKIFKDVVPHSKTTRSNFIDINSAHVGVHFIGCSTKVNSPAYELDSVYKVQMTIDDPDDIIPVKVNNFDNGTNNVCHEFSINWAKNPAKNGVVVKQKHEIKIKYAAMLSPYKGEEYSKEYDEDENDPFYNDMSILNLHDPDADYVKLLLDILHPKRAEDYELWFDVLCALAHTSASYKPLAEYFSRKAMSKFDPAGFERTWDSILAKKGNMLSLGSLHYWAKMDNPDRYEEVRHRNIFNLLYKKIYDPQIEGKLEHYDIAELLFGILKHKYVYDSVDNKGTWYEFVIDGEPHKTGELYKWRSHDEPPSSIKRYTSEVLPKLFGKVLDKIRATYEESSEGLAKYHYSIMKSFVNSCRSLRNSGFKRGVGIECEQLFEKMGFSDKLNADPDLKGVANGIIKLGKKCKLITGYHGHLVSKFTTARYKSFNPHDPITKKVLQALRNLFPDDEPDTHNYIMHYLASTLDGHKKESIMMFLVGKGSNGKSFIVELHKGAIGSTYGVKMPISFLTSRAKDAESATPALMQLKDAHFAYYSESNRCEILNVAKIKEFTGQETLSGRALHKDYINFKPKCHHLVASNNDFEIPGTDHGTWRRIDYVPMKIKFCNLATDKYCKENPYERIADPTLGTNWTEDDEVLASYLGIMVYYYESLLNNYNGKVRNVPHPNIIKETEEFRNRQDTVNNFLNCTLVKCVDDDAEMPVSVVRDRYVKWYDSRYPADKDGNRSAIAQIENSKLQKYIKKNKRENVLAGWRVLDMGEIIGDGERYYSDIYEQSEQDKVTIKTENAIEYHARLCAAHDSIPIEKADYEIEAKEKPRVVEVAESDSDSDIEEIIRKVKSKEPTKTFMKKNNIAVNVDDNGIKCKAVAPPSERREYALMGRGEGGSDTNSESESSDGDDSESGNDSD